MNKLASPRHRAWLTDTAVGLTLVACGCGDDVYLSRAHGPEIGCTDVIGSICTIAGNGEFGLEESFDQTSVPALQAPMNLVCDTLTDANGTTYLIDTLAGRIRKLTPDGMVRWFSGPEGLAGPDSDYAPTRAVFDPFGPNLLVANWASRGNNVIRISLNTGLVVGSYGNGDYGYVGDEGPAAAASFARPAGLVFDAAGNLLVVDAANQVIRAIDSDGIVHRFAGVCLLESPPPYGPGPCAEGEVPLACPDTPGGSAGAQTCGDPEIDCSPTLPCTPGYAGDDGPAQQMRTSQYSVSTVGGGIAIAPGGAIYFSEPYYSVIREIDTAGIVRRVAGRAPPNDGAASRDYSGDGGPATDALLANPVDVAVGDDGTVYVSDMSNHCVRAFVPGGPIYAVAGRCGEYGFEGDGGPATNALLKLPLGIEWVQGRLLISDAGNHRVRSVRLQ